MLSSKMVSPTILKQRIVAAIRGAFVADAASMGVHWIYDPAVMLKTVDSPEAPEFKEVPTPQYYSSKEFPGHYEKGMLSPFGEQLLFVTEYVAKNKAVDGEDMSKAMFEWVESFGGRPDHGLIAFAENMKKSDGSGAWPNCGADDDQDHIFMKIIPVTCLYAGKPELIAKVTEAIKVHQNNDRAVSFGLSASRILEAVLLGAPLDQALSTCQENVNVDKVTHKEDVIAAFDRATSAAKEFTSMTDFLTTFSHELMKHDPQGQWYEIAARNCGIMGAFAGALYLMHKAAAGELGDNVYLAAIRENILASGDTCGRSTFIGAVLAASTCETSPPQDMIDKVDPVTYAKVEAAAQAIAGTVE